MKKRRSRTWSRPFSVPRSGGIGQNYTRGISTGGWWDSSGHSDHRIVVPRATVAAGLTNTTADGVHGLLSAEFWPEALDENPCGNLSDMLAALTPQNQPPCSAVIAQALNLLQR